MLVDRQYLSIPNGNNPVAFPMQYPVDTNSPQKVQSEQSSPGRHRRHETGALFALY